MSTPRVMLLPGVVLPADLAYAGLLTVLGADAEVAVKDLEVYGEASPPPGYSLDTEVDGALREADARGWHRFHLVGYSGGGAVALACAASHPARLLSLGVLEPAWAGNWDWSPQHDRLWGEYDELSQLPHDQFMAAFMRLQVQAGVPLPGPPPRPTPPWMKQRPDGIRALLRTFQTYDLDRDALTTFDRPVYFALGGLSNPIQFTEVAERLGNVFADFTLEVFPERHHFDPPHRTEPTRLARSLMAIWSPLGVPGPGSRYTSAGRCHEAVALGRTPTRRLGYHRQRVAAGSCRHFCTASAFGSRQGATRLHTVRPPPHNPWVAGTLD